MIFMFMFIYTTYLIVYIIIIWDLALSNSTSEWTTVFLVYFYLGSGKVEDFC